MAEAAEVAEVDEEIEVAVVVVVAEEAENAAATREIAPRRLLPDRRNRNRLKTRCETYRECSRRRRICRKSCERRKRGSCKI